MLLPGITDERVPVVCSPHPLGFTALGNIFGEPAGPRALVDVPGIAPSASRAGVATVCVEARGRHRDDAALGAPEHIDAFLAAVDAAVRVGLPVDPDRVVAAGLSIGGTEALLLAARHPDRVQAVAVQNAVTDLARWYRHLEGDPRAKAHLVVLADELGGGPDIAPDGYALRSPASHIDLLSGLPVHLRVNDLDRIVPAGTQGRVLADALAFSGAHVDLVEDLPTMVPASDPGRGAHEHVSWPALLRSLLEVVR